MTPSCCAAPKGEGGDNLHLEPQALSRHQPRNGRPDSGSLTRYEFPNCVSRGFNIVNTSRLQGRSYCLHIAHWGPSEEALVLPIELAWTFVPHRESCTRSIKLTCEHFLPCRMEPKLFLELQRTHCCETAEVVMQSLSAHPCQRCKLLDIQRLLELFT